MESVYSLLNVERAVPEVYNSVYDIRTLLRAVYYMNDKKKLADIDLHLPKLVQKTALRKIDDTWVAELLKEAGLL